MTTHHIQPEQLADLAANRLTLAEVTQIRSHLIVCEDCAAKFAALGPLLDHPPSSGEEGVVANVIPNEMSGTTRDTESKSGVFQRVIAVLTFDSKQLSPAFGIRSGQSVARQLLFSVGERDLDLRIAPDDGAWIVSGQVLGECVTGHVDLCGENVAESAAMNDLCEFSLPRVPPGKYFLRVKIADQEIEVPEFELRA